MIDELARLYLLRRHGLYPTCGDTSQVSHSRPQLRRQSLKEGHMHPVPKTPFTIRYPLLVRGALALVLMGLARLGVALGWIPPEWDLTENGVEQLFDAALFAWAWFTSQRKVTPVEDPRDSLGRPLVVQGRVEPM